MTAMIKKLALPVGVFAVAIAGAFATNAAKQPAEPVPAKWVNNQCDLITKECSFDFNIQRCTDAGMDLFHYDGTSCEIPLYVKTN